MTKLRIAGANTAEAALLFGSDAGTDSAALSQQIQINDCRFEGPFQAAVVFAGSTMFVDFRHNWFFKVTDAFCNRRTPMPYRLRLNLTGNTFVQCGTGLHLQALPPSEETNRLVLKNNLFFQMKALLQLDELAEAAKVRPLFANFAGNVRDPESCLEGTLLLQPTTMDVGSLSFNTQDDRQFLRYAANSPLNQAGIDKTPVGVPPSGLD